MSKIVCKTIVMETAALEKAIKIVGSQTALAEACGVKQQHVSYWLHEAKRIPAEQVLSIERATGHQVSRHDLRPDIYPKEADNAA